MNLNFLLKQIKHNKIITKINKRQLQLHKRLPKYAQISEKLNSFLNYCFKSVRNNKKKAFGIIINQMCNNVKIFTFIKKNYIYTANKIKKCLIIYTRKQTKKKIKLNNEKKKKFIFSAVHIKKASLLFLNKFETYVYNQIIKTLQAQLLNKFDLKTRFLNSIIYCFVKTLKKKVTQAKYKQKTKNTIINKKIHQYLTTFIAQIINQKMTGINLAYLNQYKQITLNLKPTANLKKHSRKNH